MVAVLINSDNIVIMIMVVVAVLLLLLLIIIIAIIMIVAILIGPDGQLPLQEAGALLDVLRRAYIGGAPEVEVQKQRGL